MNDKCLGEAGEIYFSEPSLIPLLSSLDELITGEKITQMLRAKAFEEHNLKWEL